MSPAAAAAVEEADAAMRARARKALDRANEVRTYRRFLKEDLAAARIRLCDVLCEEIDDRLVTARPFDLIMAIPAVGKVKALGWLRSSGLTPTSTIERMTPRQRLLLVTYANGHEASSALWKRYRRKAEQA